ncbi:hypothetical protein FQA39_LY16325 [Lamprigera yunnana]|nr:hypothetical protein FQA39_LY16325 [Lamprigera yunnana]
MQESIERHIRNISAEELHRVFENMKIRVASELLGGISNKFENGVDKTYLALGASVDYAGNAINAGGSIAEKAGSVTNTGFGMGSAVANAATSAIGGNSGNIKSSAINAVSGMTGTISSTVKNVEESTISSIPGGKVGASEGTTETSTTPSGRGENKGKHGGHIGGKGRGGRVLQNGGKPTEGDKSGSNAADLGKSRPESFSGRDGKKRLFKELFE